MVTTLEWLKDGGKMFLEKYKFLRNSLFLSLASVGLAYFYFDQHPGQKKLIVSQSSNELREQTPTEKSLIRAPASVMEVSGGKAVMVLEKDPKNPDAPGVYRLKLPKGKRLYNEEKMMEIASDANLETVDLN